MLRVVRYAPGFVADLTLRVNVHLGRVPSGLALTQAQVAAALAEDPFWNRHYDDEPDRRATEAETICVLDGDRLVAVAGVWWYPRGAATAAGLGPEWAEAEEWLFVDWLLAAPEHSMAARFVVAQLLERAAATRRGVRMVGRYLFGIGWGHANSRSAPSCSCVGTPSGKYRAPSGHVLAARARGANQVSTSIPHTWPAEANKRQSAAPRGGRPRWHTPLSVQTLQIVFFSLRSLMVC